MPTDPSRLNDILREVVALPPDWHTAGSLRPAVLEAIVRYCSGLSDLHSLETGSGKSTLLFSHMSLSHKVFALDKGDGSIAMVMASRLFNRDSVELIEGPTQQTLPVYHFDRALRAVLIDGPHGFPYPHLEYYYVYPHLAPGAILIVDDIDIPCIRDLFRFLKADSMFSLIDVIRTTAFFRRTDAPTFDPLGDDWWLQGYNRRKLRNDALKAYVKAILPASLTNALGRLTR